MYGVQVEQGLNVSEDRTRSGQRRRCTAQLREGTSLDLGTSTDHPASCTQVNGHAHREGDEEEYDQIYDTAVALDGERAEGRREEPVDQEERAAGGQHCRDDSPDYRDDDDGKEIEKQDAVQRQRRASGSDQRCE